MKQEYLDLVEERWVVTFVVNNLFSQAQEIFDGNDLVIFVQFFGVKNNSLSPIVSLQSPSEILLAAEMEIGIEYDSKV